MNAAERLPTFPRDARSQFTASTNATSDTAGAPPHKGGWLSSKTGPRHLQRQAVVYVRQSSRV